MGVDRLAWYAKAGGLGVPTGIHLDDESSGLIPTAAWKKRRFREPWQKGETLSVAIGQGFNTASPMQMAVLTSAVATGGKRYKPLLLEAVKTFDGRLVHVEKPQVVGKLPVDDATLQLVQTGLWQAVNGEHGTARRIRMKDISISGKTGTSQVISRKKDEEQLPEDQMPVHQRPHAWFVAYAPSDAPKIAVAVVVEHGEHGSGAAAPISKEIIKTYLRGDKSGSRLLARKHESPPPAVGRGH